MSDMPVTESSSSETPAMPGLLSRAIGIIISPGATYAHVVRTPKVAGMLFLVALLSALAVGVPQLTETGRIAALDMIAQSSDAPVPPQVEKLAASGLLAYISMANVFVFVPIGAGVMAVLLWAVFNTIMGGTASFKQVMAVQIHSQVISTLGVLFAAPIMYSRGVMSSTGVANLAVLLPMLGEDTFLGKFLGLIDLFRIWGLVVLAIGLGTLYKRKTSNIAGGLLLLYGLIALLWAYFTTR